MKNFKKGLIYAGVLAFCIGFGAYIYCNSIKKKIPDKLYIYKQDKAVFSMDIPVVVLYMTAVIIYVPIILILESRLQSSREIPVSIMWIISFLDCFLSQGHIWR